MMLILYGKKETEFKGLGLGVLKEVQNDEVREVLNSQFELTLQYPVTGRLFDRLETNCWIKARPNPLQEPQPFRIYRITKVMNGWVTVYARHLCYQLKNYIVEACHVSMNPISEEVADLAGHIYPECPFVFWSDATEENVSLDAEAPVSVWDALGSQKGLLADNEDLEYSFDGYRVGIHCPRGTDRGVTILYGKNLRDMTVDRRRNDAENTYFPYWKGQDGVIHMLPERIYPNTYLEDGVEPIIVPADTTPEDWEEILSASSATSEEEWIRSFLEFIYVFGMRPTGELEPTLEVDFVQLSKTEEYIGRPLPDDIDLGDTVHVAHPQLQVSYSARVREIRFQPSIGMYKKIVLGSPKATIVRSLNDRIGGKEPVVLGDGSAEA